MGEWLSSFNLQGVVTPERLYAILRALFILVAGLLLARFLSSALNRAVSRRMAAQEAMLVKQATFYVLLALSVATAMHELGFHLSVLLGAAGILTVAVGFASQTSASNLISGLFLIVERPFVVGDVVLIEGTTGEVLSIDLLSVKLRTFDNLFVRVPNELIIRSKVSNLTRFPLRRVDVSITVGYREDLERLHRVLRRVAAANALTLAEPEPLFIVMGFAASGVELQFSVWGTRENYLELKNSIQHEIKQVFAEEGIEIPYPHQVLHNSRAGEALAVRLVDERRATPVS